MKLLRYGAPGHEKPGIQHSDGTIRDLSSVVDDIAGLTLLKPELDRLRALDFDKLPVVSSDSRIGACVGSIGKFICIGLNYSDHAAETGAELPKEPIIFSKFTSAIVGAYDNVVIPRASSKMDWEVELGFVIGKPAKYVTMDQAMEHVAGYCIVNDVSEREFQIERSGQWVKGKSSDSFGPLGPWLVTADEIVDPQSLRMWLEVDGKRYQDGTSETMIFGVAYLVHYLSQFFTLHPGDVISTGTPPGVGMGVKPEPVYLRAGQTMRLGVQGLGEQQQRVVADD